MATKKKAKASKKKSPAKKATKKVAKKASKKAAKKPVKKASAKKVSKKAVKKAKTKTKRKPNAAFMKPLTPSAALAAVVGDKALPRTEAVKKLWAYIKKQSLQDSVNKRMIHADDKLAEIFGNGQFSMFDVAKGLKKHLH